MVRWHGTLCSGGLRLQKPSNPPRLPVIQSGSSPGIVTALTAVNSGAVGWTARWAIPRSEPVCRPTGGAGGVLRPTITLVSSSDAMRPPPGGANRPRRADVVPQGSGPQAALGTTAQPDRPPGILYPPTPVHPQTRPAVAGFERAKRPGAVRALSLTAMRTRRQVPTSPDPCATGRGFLPGWFPGWLPAQGTHAASGTFPKMATAYGRATEEPVSESDVRPAGHAPSWPSHAGRHRVPGSTDGTPRGGRRQVAGGVSSSSFDVCRCQ